MGGLVEIHEAALEARKQDSATLLSQRTKFQKVVFGLEKKVAELEKKAVEFRAKDLYYCFNEMVLAEDSKQQLLQLGHEVKDLRKENEALNSTNAQLTLQAQASSDLQAKVDRLSRELESAKRFWQMGGTKRRNFSTQKETR